MKCQAIGKMCSLERELVIKETPLHRFVNKKTENFVISGFGLKDGAS